MSILARNCLIAYFQSSAPESLGGMELDQLLAKGWFRMHQAIFTTTHWQPDQFYRAHWLRYALAELADRPSHRRIRNRNRDFWFIIDDLTVIRPDHQELYARYRASIAFDCASTIQQVLFGEGNPDRNIYQTKSISVFEQDKLVGGGYFDVGEKSAASVLHFWDPLYKRHSIGKYLMLLTANFLKSQGYEWYYPGYVLAGNPKMDYKLFLGSEAAQYFDPETGTWKPFQDSILLKEEYSDDDLLKLRQSIPW